MQHQVEAVILFYTAIEYLGCSWKMPGTCVKQTASYSVKHMYDLFSSFYDSLQRPWKGDHEELPTSVICLLILNAVRARHRISNRYTNMASKTLEMFVFWHAAWFAV
jgi:hypothetical protein